MCFRLQLNVYDTGFSPQMRLDSSMVQEIAGDVGENNRHYLESIDHYRIIG